MLKDPDNPTYRFWVGVITCLIKMVFKIEFKGLENLPSSGPCIFVANHQSYLDVPLLGIAYNQKGILYNTYWVMGKQTYRNPLLYFIYRVAPVIVVNGTVRKADWALKNGYGVNIFPEGFYTWHRYKWIRQGKDLGTLKRTLGNSAAILASKAGYPVVPIGIQGTERALPPFKVFPRPGKLILNIGKPFRLDSPEPEEMTEEMILQRSTFIMKHVDALR